MIKYLLSFILKFHIIILVDVIIFEIEKFNLNELYTFYRAFFHMDI